MSHDPRRIDISDLVICRTQKGHWGWLVPHKGPHHSHPPPPDPGSGIRGLICIGGDWGLGFNQSGPAGHQSVGRTPEEQSTIFSWGMWENMVPFVAVAILGLSSGQFQVLLLNWKCLDSWRPRHDPPLLLLGNTQVVRRDPFARLTEALVEHKVVKIVNFVCKKWSQSEERKISGYLNTLDLGDSRRERGQTTVIVTNWWL